jgi:hypothetical protein
LAAHLEGKVAARVRLVLSVTNLQRFGASVTEQRNTDSERQAMRASTIILASALIAVPTLALADPTGTYSVTGRNANTGNTYRGTVAVSRTGATYKVVWNIAGKESVGTALGSHFENDTTIATGPATDKDSGLSIGYINNNSFGIGTYYLRPDGSWSGVWTYGGSQHITSETWTRQ